MASVQRRAGRRTFYLDTSTLSYAFRGLRSECRYEGDQPELAALGDSVTRIARDANLCLTTMHIMEWARWRDTRTADALIEWIDSLEIVWLHGMQYVAEDEDEVSLQRALGFDARTTVEIFSPSMLSTFHALKIDQLTEALNCGSPLRSVFEAARIHGGKAQEAEMARIIRTFHFDRFEDPATRGLTLARKEEVRRAKLRQSLRVGAEEAYERLAGGTRFPASSMREASSPRRTSTCSSTTCW
ncbi:MAG: hypothetical protein KF819_06060 [Labilithrix sp.]|nr:hypothetical protein [Labilithrix sp.]